DCEVRALEINVHDRVEHFFGHGFEGRQFNYPCVDEKHVNTPELFLYYSEKLIYLGKTGGVGAHGQDVVAELLRRLVERLLVSPGDDYPRALFLELFCRG